MGKITGLGGVFIKSADPKALAAWYQEHLGIDFNGNIYVDFSLTDKDGTVFPGANVLSFFKQESNYFQPSDKQTMINLRVSDMEGFLKTLADKGVNMVGEPMNEDYGKFAWIMDPEGNKIELWEPPQK